MNPLNNFRKNILYFFLSLPFVIILYEFLMTITFVNRGYTILLLGQIGAVPLLLLILNFLFMNNLILNAFSILFLLSLLGGIIYFLWFFLS
jgi:hypothetical protein